MAWLCICDCGKEKVVASAHLKGALIKSCGCLDVERKYSQFSEDTPWKQIYSYYKRRAKKINKEFNISHWRFLELITSKCKYCGKEPSNVFNKKYSSRKDGRPHKQLLYNGIDRVDNSNGYTISNTVSCCMC
jgi:hypothetical protein